jgi:hypothetical protein
LEIDNNAAERALRVVALGRNYAQWPIMRSTAGVYLDRGNVKRPLAIFGYANCA